MEKAKNQLEEVIGLAKENMTKLLERDGKLNDLETTADQLAADSEKFHVNCDLLQIFSI